MNQNQLKAQCELYKLLLNADSGRDDEIDAILEQALRLVAEITGAQLAYIELINARDEIFWSAHQCTQDDIETIKKHISSGIITDAIASGETILSASAFLDERFQHYKSV